jgi:hypothetical protein
VVARLHQSIQASAPARTGAPDGDGCQGTPANLSAPVVAKVRHRASCRAFSTLTQKAPAAAIRGQLTEVFAGRMAISGGSSDTDVKEPIAIPTGVSSSIAVTMTTPVGK